MAKGDAMPYRFWQKVEKTSTCWLWTASKDAKGYGHFRLDGRIQKAHRIAWCLTNGPIPDGLTIDHVRARGCRSTSCVNPAHMELVTSGINSLRGGNPLAVNARKTHCYRGHPLTGENVRIETTGSRRCRECLRLRRSGA